jgi:hypothetical protein
VDEKPHQNLDQSKIRTGSDSAPVRGKTSANFAPVREDHSLYRITELRTETRADARDAPPVEDGDAEHGIPATPISVFLSEHGVKTAKILNNSTKRKAIEAADCADREGFRRAILESDRDPSTVLRIAQRIAPSERQPSTGGLGRGGGGGGWSSRQTYRPTEKREAYGAYIDRAIKRATEEVRRRVAEEEGR